MNKPLHGNFSCGPCAKRAGWQVPSMRLVGRSHRSADGMQLIQNVINLQKKILKLPQDYLLGIVSASSTGAMEALLWSLLGANGVDVIAHCVFSNHWARDVVDELKISDVRIFKEKFPKMADTSGVNFDRDCVFCLSSTTSGVAFKNTDWIATGRKGLTICDAASAAFVMDLDWTKLDAVAFSWQKGLGGEAGFGTIVLSPKAVERLETYKPQRGIPRIFRIADNKKINKAIFEGFTINTPSMICVEDFYEALQWADANGGMDFLVKKTAENYEVIENWISGQSDFKFLVDEKYRARHIACFDIVSEKYQALSEDEKWKFLKKIVAICEQEKVGFDFLGHIWTKPHLRVWCGPTVEKEDLQKFLPWLEYAYHKVM
ncbi:MAG: phosphoserine transaminase [Alphaproteobacteria bacterium]|nr:phosphoserine transaminase [Alphaproteobacteria bacterium]